MQIRCTFARARSSREYVWSFNDPIARGVLPLARRRPPEDAAAHRTHLAPKTNIYIQLARNGATGQHRALSHNSLNINTPPKSPIPNKRARLEPRIVTQSVTRESRSRGYCGRKLCITHLICDLSKHALHSDGDCVCGEWCGSSARMWHECASACYMANAVVRTVRGDDGFFVVCRCFFGEWCAAPWDYDLRCFYRVLDDWITPK